MNSLSILTTALAVLFWFFRPREIWNMVKHVWGYLKGNKSIIESFTYKNDDFAHDTIRYRFRNILHELNNYYEDAVAEYYQGEELREMFQKRPFSYDTCMEKRFAQPKELMKKLTKNEQNELKKLYEKYLTTDKTNNTVFKEAPFIEAEHFFYFYILDVFYGLPTVVQEYMSDGARKVMDPYKLKKKKSIKDDIKGEESYILECLNRIGMYFNECIPDPLMDFVKLSLDTNSCDLSQLGGKTIHPLPEQNIYPNEIKNFVNYFFLEGNRGEKKSEPTMVINYLVDNGSVEFFSDLTFAFVALNMRNIKEVNFYVNKLPIFVSDVVEDDYVYMMETIRMCIEDMEINADKKKFYIDGLNRIEDLVATKRINIKPDFIWNLPTEYELLAKDKIDVFGQKNSVLIIKGDLNYRRLAGDKKWFFGKNLEKITQSYLKSPTLVIRSFKSDLVLDYTRRRYWANNNKTDNNYWRENGEYGTIRFLPKK